MEFEVRCRLIRGIDFEILSAPIWFLKWMVNLMQEDFRTCFELESVSESSGRIEKRGSEGLF